MKTAIARFFVNALLLAAMGERAPAAAAEGPTTVPVLGEFGRPANPARLKPFVAFAWSPTARMEHVSTMLRDDGDPVKLAFATKTMEQGRRVILGFTVPGGLVGQPQDNCVDAQGKRREFTGIWPEHGIDLVRRRCDLAFAAFAFAGGKCDLLVTDYEEGWTHWSMTAENLRAIEDDPRFPPVRKLLGFGDLAERVGNWRAHPDDAAKWDSVETSLLNEAMNQAVGAPLWKHLPDCGLSNFMSATISRANAVPDPNGNLYYVEGMPFGTCQSPGLYGAVGNIQITGYPGDWKSPMTVLVWSADIVRASVRSSDFPVISWVAYRSYNGDGPGRPQIPWANTDYWQENVYHAMLSSAGNNLLMFNPHPPRENGPAGAAREGSSPEDEQALEDALATLDSQAHGSPLATALCTENIDYRASVLVSAARTQAGHVVARVTFAPGTDSAEVKIAEAVYHAVRPQGGVGAWIQVP
jgi:hypothetical protein